MKAQTNERNTNKGLEDNIQKQDNFRKKFARGIRIGGVAMTVAGITSGNSFLQSFGINCYIIGEALGVYCDIKRRYEVKDEQQ